MKGTTGARNDLTSAWLASRRTALAEEAAAQVEINRFKEKEPVTNPVETRKPKPAAGWFVTKVHP